MSAIVAAAARELTPETVAWVADATDHLTFAGPDAQAVAVGRRCAMGHAQLRTAADEPAQPLTDGHGVWLTADVRLDDRRGLRASLPGAMVDHGSGDAALLLAAYRMWGEAFVEHLAGEYAFVLWDSRRGRLLCARDQIGIVPLHHARAGGEVLIATSVEALLLHPRVSHELDDIALADFVVRGRGEFAATAFRSVARLPPAHVMSVSAHEGTMRMRRFWAPPDDVPLVRLDTSRDYTARFQDLLRDAVADRITSSPLSVQVSGGMDSTSVTAFAHEVLTGRNASRASIRGVNAVLGGDSGDLEGEYAHLLADALGLELDVIDAAALGPLDPFAAPEPPTPEPVPYRWSKWEYEILRTSARHARVVLSGLGADPLLQFVPSYWAQWAARGRVARLARAWTDHARLLRERPHLYPKEVMAYARGRMTTAKPSPPPWLARELAARVQAEERMRPVFGPARAHDMRSLTGEPMWSVWFMWADPSFTQLALRVRHPFTDLRLLRFVAGLAPEPWLVRKRILRQATAGLLPAEIRGRPKTPLVQSPREVLGPATVDRVREFVRAVPAADRFIDRDALVATLQSLDQQAGTNLDVLLASPLGLVFWLAHWRAPQGANRSVRLLATCTRIDDTEETCPITPSRQSARSFPTTGLRSSTSAP